MAKRAKKVRLYVGWDGSWVFSRTPLRVHRSVDGSDAFDFLSPGQAFIRGKRNLCVDVPDAGTVSSRLRKLKMHEVVTLTITYSKPRKARRK